MPSNPYATGGGGGDFERRLATAYVCSALVGAPVSPFGEQTATIWLQAGHLGCEIDDIVVELHSVDESKRRIYISVKSAINPRGSDEQFRDTIGKAWKQWNCPKNFNRGKDAFGIAAAVSRSPRIHLFSRLTEVARASTSSSDFEHRLSLAGYQNVDVRELLPETCAVIERSDTAASLDNIWQFLRALFVSSFDFDAPASQDKSRVIGLLQLGISSRSLSEAEACWNAVFEKVSRDTADARVFDEQALAELAKQHQFQRDVPRHVDQWLTKLRAHSRLTRAGIKSQLFVNGQHLDRPAALETLRSALASSRFVLVTGPAGCGKSALALEAADEVVDGQNVFCFQSEEFAHPHLDNALQAAGLRDLNAEEWGDAMRFEKRVLYVEAAERLLQTSGSSQAFSQLLEVAAKDQRWLVVATCRDYLADHLRATWPVTGGWIEADVPLLRLEEVQQLTHKSKLPQEWLAQPIISHALRNLKWLDLTLRAADEIDDEVPLYAWSSLAQWRQFLWKQLLKPELHPQWQEVLLKISHKRASQGIPWIAVEQDEIEAAAKLVAEGILRRQGFTNLFRPEHDLIEDWALLSYAERIFAEFHDEPEQLFARLGPSLLIRRAFRQFFGERLELSENGEAVSFFRTVFANETIAKEWKQEITISLLGSACALETLRATSDFWLVPDGLGLLCHVLRIAYLRKTQENNEAERPFGPGWAAVMAFIHEQGDPFLRQYTGPITHLLLDWHSAITHEIPKPSGLEFAARLVQGLWVIATEGHKRFEDYWGEENRHYPAHSNRLVWLVAAVASALTPKFFVDAARIAMQDRGAVRSENRELVHQSRDLLKFLVSDYRAWSLARARPRTMVRLCLQAYGLRKPRTQRGGYGFYADRSCGLTTSDMDFSPPSALRGPFFELLQQHPKLGQRFMLRLINEATSRRADQGDDNSMEEVFHVTVRVDGGEISQIADQGWWRCYRGWSPYNHVLECALMALEKWLLENIGAKQPERLEELLLHLIAESSNVAVTGVCASVATVFWWHCGRVAAVLLDCWPLLSLDRHRWMNDQTQGGFGAWRGEHSIYLEERRVSNGLPHRQEHVEHLILKAQLGPGREHILPVLDALQAEVASVTPDKVTDDVRTARLILHRIDARNLKAEPSPEVPGQVLLQPIALPSDLQEHLDETAEKMKITSLPIEMQNWAWQILEPLPNRHPQPERWREFLTKAREFNLQSLDREHAFVLGEAPAIVAAICLDHRLTELKSEELKWCIARVTGPLLAQGDLTVWHSRSLLSTWQSESAAARVCGKLLTSYQGDQKDNLLQAVAIALTHPEKRVRVAAAQGLGDSASNSAIQFRACELLIQHARYSRALDLRHRGPLRLPYENIATWEDRRSLMHAELLAETKRLRERFTTETPPDARTLVLFYPRGHEEEQNLPALAALLPHNRSEAGTKLLLRIRDWLVIQLVDENDHVCRQRLYAVDEWRHPQGSVPRFDPVNSGDVSRLLSRRILNGSAQEAIDFFQPILADERVAHLRAKAGEFLKDLCLVLDESGKSDIFWTVWEQFADAAIGMTEYLNDEDYWKQRRLSVGAARNAFSALIGALFLNDMYFKEDQHWSPAANQLYRFRHAFLIFNPAALNPYISFLNTIGDGLLPGTFLDISICVSALVEQTGKTFLTRLSQVRLLRLLKKHNNAASATKHKELGKAMLHLLDVLADAGSAEAFRVRETVARVF